MSVFVGNFGDFRNYTSQCFIDGQSLPTVLDDPNQMGSNVRLCAGFSLPDEMHILFVSVSVPVDQNPVQNGWATGFFLDYIVVEPSPSSDLSKLNRILSFDRNPFSGGPVFPFAESSADPSWWYTIGEDGSGYTFVLPFTGTISF